MEEIHEENKRLRDLRRHEKCENECAGIEVGSEGGRVADPVPHGTALFWEPGFGSALE
jgi:hypothetical protein